MKKLTLFFFCILLMCCCHSAKPTEQELELINQINRIFCIREQLAEKYWPEFNEEQFSAPIIFFADSSCYIVNPTQSFLKEFDCEKIHSKNFDLYKSDRLDPIPFHMETYMNLSSYLKGYLHFSSDAASDGRTPYIMCSTLNEAQKIFDDIPDETEWIPMVIHELVHGCHDSHPSYYAVGKSVEYPVSTLEFAGHPTKYSWLGEALVAENQYLLSAIDSGDTEEMNGYIKEFLLCRKNRKERMRKELGEDIVTLEERLETSESLGRFMEVQSAVLLGSTNPKYTEGSFFFSGNVQQAYFFVTGYNLIRLFVKLDIDIDLLYSSNTHKTMESYILDNNPITEKQEQRHF